MYWYRQLPRETMKLIAFTSTAKKDHDFGGFSQEKFAATNTAPENQTDASDVNQMAILWKPEGDNATMHCSHTKGINYYQMYWYRQLPGEAMKQAAFTSVGSKEPDFGKFSKDKF
ncbi:hypothetical protein Q8A73_017818 [Channa argus]|nr:hypothetical protein Q8A73_017818 [Channa argus]